MLLYHGTTASRLEQILESGITPRGRRKGNWQHTVNSHPKAVYLTNAYALHYGKCSIKKNDERVLILEIDGDALDPNLFGPDEDFLEQATRKSPAFPEIHGLDMVHRTKWFRERLIREFQHAWETSLECLGNITYHDIIPRTAILRHAVIPVEDPLVMWACDPTITVLNYSIMGEYYRQLTRYVFEGNIEKKDAFNVENILKFPRNNVNVTVHYEE